MWSNAVMSAAVVPYGDGRITAGTILQQSATSTRNLLDAAGRWAFLPVVPGAPYHFSALLNDAAASVDILFRTITDGHVALASSAFAGVDGDLTRTTVSTVVPAGAALAKVRVRGPGRVAEPVVSMGRYAPVGPVYGAGCEGVQVEDTTPDLYMTDTPDGPLAAYQFTIREAVSL